MFDGKLTLTRIITAYFLAKLAQSLLFEVYNSNVLYPISLIGVLAVFIGLLNLLCYPNTVPVKHLFIRNNAPVQLRTVMGLCALIALYKYGSAIIYYGYSEFFNNSSQEIVNELKQMAAKDLSERFDILFYTKVTIAPLVEEVVYRVVLLGYLLTRYKANIAILVSSLVFGIFHGVDGFFMSFIGGVFLSYVYIKFRSFWLCVGLHAFVNLFVLLTPGLVSQTLLFSTQTTPDLMIAVFNILCALLTIAIAFYTLIVLNRKLTLFRLQKMIVEEQ